MLPGADLNELYLVLLVLISVCQFIIVTDILIQRYMKVK